MIDKILVIVGPTASGKTDLAYRLAKKINGEIICADSRTIYRGMDIGTAKPTKLGQSRVRHYLLDEISPDQPFSVSQFKQSCLKAIRSIQKTGKIPIIVGGSGLYIDSVLYDYNFRAKNALEEDFLDYSDECLIQEAKKAFPKEQKVINSGNRRRIIQLLNRGQAQKLDRKNSLENFVIIGLNPKSSTLQEKISLRTKNMLRQGLVQEVKWLLRKYGRLKLFLETPGYVEVVKYLDGDIAKTELGAQINKSNKKLVKKQLTWFKRNKDIVWFETSDEAERYTEQFLTKS